MAKGRNRIIAPRNVVNTKQIYIFYILKELAKGHSVFGNRVYEDFKNRFEDSTLPFPVSTGTIYDTLYDLEERGYVTSHWEGDEFLNKRSKKLYSITDRGLEYYKTHVNDYIDNLKKTKSLIDALTSMLTK
ncbi:PadR family transcriptional regulator [Clostridium fallax]|uniref:Transcriptional regulator, PadR family n=1 Tax=Clostridium fallax TaxID=1533 RepID=A0A1M4XGL5_9CLOT|nr:PadR family transcriptional regulator [Clostridium fallax]SHE92817.1 transcriptional regulator, PadR family [Clostridium fallax]SQB06395.1 PadR family transcriptional regulator [Clostridium fallax]